MSLYHHLPGGLRIRQKMERPVKADPDRKSFEDAVFAHYQRLKVGGWTSLDEGDFSRESLFWLQPNGQYGIRSVEAAWWGWNLKGATAKVATAESVYQMLPDDALRRTSIENVQDVISALQAHTKG